MLALEIIGGLLLAWLALECIGHGLDRVVKHRAVLLAWAGIVAALIGLYMWQGTPGVTGGVLLLIAVGLVADKLR
jgi:hypothetical protein